MAADSAAYHGHGGQQERETQVHSELKSADSCPGQAELRARELQGSKINVIE